MMDVSHNIELLASAARTAETQSDDQLNIGCRGLLIMVNVSALTAGASITPRLLGKNPITGVYYLIGEAPTPITATGQYSYAFGPGAASYGGSIQQAVEANIPLEWAFVMQVADTKSVTYSVAGAMEK